MSAQRVTEHVFRVTLTFVNVFLIVLPDGITMVDAGLRRSFPKIEKAIRELGRRPEDVKDIVATHLHADHTGGLAEARAATGARVWIHPVDARMVAAGESRRPMSPAPGSIAGQLYGLFAGITTAKVPPVAADGLANDREEIPVAGGLLPIWTPGHTEGHVAYLWKGDGGVLFVGDAARRGRLLQVSPIYEDYRQGLRSLRELATLDFQVACFAHGRPLTQDAAAEFRRMWGPPAGGGPVVGGAAGSGAAGGASQGMGAAGDSR
jgi:glyoxylase-like metal-dependent hydrolase (beta-lactamase superfamily II)